jgi:phage baseplate assembly protein W
VTTEPTSIANPLRFANGDFASTRGAALLAAQVRHVLLTEGEMPWRTSFAAGVDRLRHRRTDAVTLELARVRVRDALARWLPDVELRRVDTVAAGGVLTLRIEVRRGPAAATVSVEVPT